jgi:hypothetical protein
MIETSWRPWRFGIRTLLTMMLAVATYCAGWMANEERHRQAEEDLRPNVMQSPKVPLYNGPASVRVALREDGKPLDIEEFNFEGLSVDAANADSRSWAEWWSQLTDSE